jgi:hypothetical protein
MRQLALRAEAANFIQTRRRSVLDVVDGVPINRRALFFPERDGYGI